MRTFFQLFSFEIKTIMSDFGTILISMLFFVICNAVFAFLLAHDAGALRSAGPVIIWITALLSLFNACQNIVKNDLQTDFLTQIRLSNIPIEQFFITKTLAYWVFSGMIITLLSPFFSFMYGLSLEQSHALCRGILIGTLIISFIYHLIAIISQKRTNSLTIVLAIPLSTPIVIISLLMTNKTSEYQHLDTLVGILLINIPLCIFLSTQALKTPLKD